ncbi:hypothetical protein OHA25_60190 (plasmid) [Nonomuraea sp. NBC_00507]|uniref:hypothetical protein n=1 Tax=Nonomuraea sp. NBC_00507 TaxID=2976002 RepID=UPI002E17D813
MTSTHRAIMHAGARLAAVAVAVVFLAGMGGPAHAGTSSSRVAAVAAESANLDCEGDPRDAQLPTASVGATFDPPPSTAPPAGRPGQAFGPDATVTIPEIYGYAGLVWNRYDLGCGPAAILNYGAVADTYFGQIMLDIATMVVAVTNSAHRAATSPTVVDRLDETVAAATRAVSDGVAAWLGPSIILVGLSLAWIAHRRDLPQAMRMVAWLVVALTMWAALWRFPTTPGDAADVVVTDTISNFHAGFVGQADAPNAQAAHSGLLVEAVLYRSWLRGVFGDPDSPTAQKHGPTLFQCQAISLQEARQPNELSKVILAKRETWKKTAAQIKEEDPAAYQYLTGEGTNRAATGLMALIAAVVVSFFDLVASLAVVFALITVRMVVIILPLLLVVGLHLPGAHVLKQALQATAGSVLSALLYAVGSGLSGLLARELLGRDAQINLPSALLLYLILTVVLFVVIRRIRGNNVFPRSMRWLLGYWALSKTRALVLGTSGGPRKPPPWGPTAGGSGRRPPPGGGPGGGGSAGSPPPIDDDDDDGGGGGGGDGGGGRRRERAGGDPDWRPSDNVDYRYLRFWVQTRDPNRRSTRRPGPGEEDPFPEEPDYANPWVPRHTGSEEGRTGGDEGRRRPRPGEPRSPEETRSREARAPRGTDAGPTPLVGERNVDEDGTVVYVVYSGPDDPAHEVRTSSPDSESEGDD